MAENNQSPPGMNTQEAGSFWSRHSRLFIRLIIIAVIIVGAVIYSNQQNPSEEEATNNQDEDSSSDDTAVTEGDNDGNIAGINVTDRKDDTQEVMVAKDETPQESVMVSGGQITVAVERGNGYTHLARRAIAEYLKTHEVSDFQAEHKIFAEDYLQKSITDKHRLFAGDEVNFSEDAIKQAVDAALSLTDAQVHNLSQYVF